MSLAVLAGAAPRLLCLPLLVAMLASFNGQTPAQARAQRDYDEFRANFDGVVQNAAARAGAPIHVDPYIHTAPHNGHAGGHRKGC
jgi:hypothetical protein